MVGEKMRKNPLPVKGGIEDDSNSKCGLKNTFSPWQKKQYLSLTLRDAVRHHFFCLNIQFVSPHSELPSSADFLMSSRRFGLSTMRITGKMSDDYYKIVKKSTIPARAGFIHCP
jgi:hypothetical protein